MVIGNPLTMPIMGIVTGHTYYFAVDPLPDRYGHNIITTPTFIIELFGGGGYGAGPSTGFQATAPPGRNQPPPRPGYVNRGGHNWGAGRPLGTE